MMRVVTLNPDDQRLFDQLSRVSIDTASGLLMGLGYPDQYITHIMPVTQDVKMVGRARTLRYLPIRQDLSERMKAQYSFSLLHHAIEETDAGDVLMVDCGGCTESGFIGDVMISRFIIRGGTGIVVDGAIRDLSAIRHMGLPVFTRGVHAAVSQRRLVAVDYQVCVRCSEVTVMPGDIILGDDEGTIVIPAHLAKEVARRGVETEHREAFLRRTIEEGVRPLHEVYPPNDAVKQAYEKYKQSEAK